MRLHKVIYCDAIEQSPGVTSLKQRQNVFTVRTTAFTQRNTHSEDPLHNEPWKKRGDKKDLSLSLSSLCPYTERGRNVVCYQYVFAYAPPSNFLAPRFLLLCLHVANFLPSCGNKGFHIDTAMN